MPRGIAHGIAPEHPPGAASLHDAKRPWPAPLGPNISLVVLDVTHSKPGRTIKHFCLPEGGNR